MPRTNTHSHARRASFVTYRTEAQCDNAALLAATLAGYESGIWPDPEIGPADTPAEQTSKVQDAMVGAGFPASTAAAVTSTNQYEALVSWAEGSGTELSEMASSRTALISAALDAKALLSLTKEDLRISGLSPEPDGRWSLTLSLKAYDAARVNPELLKAAVGIVGCETLGGDFSAKDLGVSVTPAADAVEITVTPPAEKSAYFMKSVVR